VTTASPSTFRCRLHRWHDLEAAADRSAWSLYAAEFLGTALLLIGGLSAVIFIVSSASPFAALTSRAGWRGASRAPCSG